MLQTIYEDYTLKVYEAVSLKAENVHLLKLKAPIKIKLHP